MPWSVRLSLAHHSRAALVHILDRFRRIMPLGLARHDRPRPFRPAVRVLAGLVRVRH